MLESSENVTRKFFEFVFVEGVLCFWFHLVLCTLRYEINGVCSSFFSEVALV